MRATQLPIDRKVLANQFIHLKFNFNESKVTSRKNDSENYAVCVIMGGHLLPVAFDFYFMHSVNMKISVWRCQTEISKSEVSLNELYCWMSFAVDAFVDGDKITGFHRAQRAYLDLGEI